MQRDGKPQGEEGAEVFSAEISRQSCGGSVGMAGPSRSREGQWPAPLIQTNPWKLTASNLMPRETKGREQKPAPCAHSEARGDKLACLGPFLEAGRALSKPSQRVGWEMPSALKGSCCFVFQLAQIFEDQLKEAILEEDGQIAFSNLAASAVSSVLPKMETHGQLGKAR